MSPAYYCVACGKTTTHLNVKQAAEAVEVSRVTVYVWIRKGFVHGVQRPSGAPFICMDSLLSPLTPDRRPVGGPRMRPRGFFAQREGTNDALK